MNKRGYFLSRGCAAAALAALTLSACGDNGDSGADGEELTEIVIAEPVHMMGYLPMYIAMDEGIFEEHGLDVEIYSVAEGGGHINAVLAGQAWGFIGGPEHNSYVAARPDNEGVETKAISAVVNRGNLYLVPRDGVEAPALETMEDLEDFFPGQRIVTGASGGTENSITRYILNEVGLSPDDLDAFQEATDSAARLTLTAQGEGDYAFVADPVLQEGLNEGVWGEPILSIPDLLGEYSYSTVNVPLATYEDDPETAQAFVDAMAEALRVIHEDPETAQAVAVEQFSNLEEDVVIEVFERSIADDLWPSTPYVTEESITMALDVVRGAGALEDEDDPVTYEDIADMRFAE
ncbi:ABC transporter substrate-binding protein [Nesterenkonia alkaliphila]|uniref:ABC transporter substrate-binding protein n=1 Tax=Nesterenkonia alkaliphila TaxID=1463631 RepID=A0A7K1UEZ4_9MICC|nr:ABC transporter substrate-binding protein [Nesterenkonia alkaliphila]MVT25047.1 ABC transporter substrate-binding protein [Nesterenkonia alkaliphila]GFZ97452.1 hypothetical protein GCM10011359_28490 [Nesterenkonia alkaliphila]